MPVPDQLASLRGVFGDHAAHRAEQLLQSLRGTRLRATADVIRLHETALFLRAYPQSPAVVALTDEILFAFASRMQGTELEPFEDPEISGIAGTTVSTNFTCEFARDLIARHSAAILIDWENYAHPERLGPILARLLPLAAEDWTVEPHPDWRRWFEAGRVSLPQLLDSVEARTYDLLEIPLRWNLGDSSASRSRARLARRNIFYHSGPLIKRNQVSIEAELASRPISIARVQTNRARRLFGLIVDTSAVRYRELWGFLHPDLEHVYHADLGRGTDFFFCGVPRKWRLPMRAYHAGMFFKNGVPIGYFEGLSLFDRMECGFNLYYTFREGETAWLYARLLKLFHQQLGVTSFSIDPYQIGHDNEEAIASGAFWFYRKLGFRPASEETARLSAREEHKVASRPGYRTPPATLRKLARAPLIYGPSRDWDNFSLPELGYRMGPGKAGLWESLGIPPKQARVIRRAKNGHEETSYLRLLQSLPEVRSAVLR